MRYVVSFILLATCLYAVDVIKIGVLAKRSAEVSHKRWDDTAIYLSEKIPSKKFEIVPIPFDSINKAVKDKKVSFILTNSGMYVELDVVYGAQRIATLINKHISGLTQREFGGVLITHVDNKDKFTDLESIKGSSIAAVNKKSLGGWQMLWRELVDNGIDVDNDLESVVFKGTHDNVVHSVINKDIELGTVRTDTLERMSMEGKIDISKIHVLNKKSYDGFPYYVSTKLYPEWPMAKLKGTPDELSKQVSIALMTMDKDSKAAKSASIAGWSIPLSYQSVHECFKILQIPPYYQKIEFIDVIKKYWQWIIFYMILAIAGISMLIYQFKLTSYLKNTQEELVQTEKMASLGRLVAGIAHEINTPIGVGVTAASHLHKETEKFNNDYKEDKLTKSSFEEFIDVAIQSSNIILSNLDRAANMIHNFKQISVDQSSDDTREFLVNEYIVGIVDSLKPALKAKSHSIDIECPYELKIESNPGVFSQIFSNLILNSVIHGFDEIDNGQINIILEKLGNDLRIVYYDNGKGMSKENLKKIYDPFFTTKRSQGGSGLGTHIIYNLITQKLNGSIYAESEEGKGLKYIIDLKGIKYV